ncbi:DUF4246 domain-containing protein [Aspergillus clavatus NRRL 1]|uniref:Uncharacterized protein n=1 Tax=Aspergillus clavatus (strain ATCC 1007 / CBS 513.65 / DSM 816 / NCTC 3887 / NRRL 1 / QM 1276 / 107) TaxID=344612 RepID=A1CLL3_ASPCL|nr:uncharacterized protein ACLA_042600 [Aspergillus clavatus NRRL 1]EAW10037.1 hypothetical protein ACLA_042600 [Aspergillus clavatus NRRL 1]
MDDISESTDNLESKHVPIPLDNRGNGLLRVPGFSGIPIEYEIPSDARFAHGINEWRQAPAVTARELAMVAAINRLTDHANWHLDVFNDTVISHWREEAFATSSLMSEKAWGWCVQELRDKAKYFRQNDHIRVLDTGSCVCKSDTPSLRALGTTFRQAVRPVLRIQMEQGLLYWRSKRVLSIVDPYLFPLIYGRSLVLVEGGRVKLENVLAAYRGATVAPAHVDRWKDTAYVQETSERQRRLQLGVSPNGEKEAYRWSPNYQCLPCEVEFVGDIGTQVRITSYINNLHPVHQDLYHAIETLIGRVIPLWNDCLVQGQRGWDDVLNQGQLGPVPLRIITYGVEWENELQEWLFAFEVPDEVRKRLYRKAREDFQSSIGDNTDKGRAKHLRAQRRMEGLSDVVGREDMELPPQDSDLWERAKKYLELPEDGSATPVSVPDDWHEQRSPWWWITDKYKRLLFFKHPEPGIAFSYDDWKSGQHQEKAIVDMVHERKDWGSHPFEPVTPPHKPYTITLQETFRTQGLQVIVKMENIELTPNSQIYSGTDWQMEGQLNEHIVAVAMFAYDVDNITEPRVAFRQNTKLDESFYRYNEDREQGRRRQIQWGPDHRFAKRPSVCISALEEVLGYPPGHLHIDIWGTKNWQDKGVVTVSQGRLITFPNVLEHRAESFTLADLSRPGHYRSITLYLVDPHYRVCSTRNVPPQQHHWWAEAVGADLTAAGLPQEMVDEIMQGSDSWPMGLPEARRHRRDFLKEHRWNEMVRIGTIRYPEFH